MINSQSRSSSFEETAGVHLWTECIGLWWVSHTFESVESTRVHKPRQDRQVRD